MSVNTNVGSLIICCFIVSMLMVKPAYAYLDPGTGSIIFQGLLAAIAAVAIALKIYWHKILVLLGIRKKVNISEKKSNATMRSFNDESN